MNKKTKEMISKGGLCEHPTYTVDDLKVLVEQLTIFVNAKELEADINDSQAKAFKIVNQIKAFDYDPIFFEGWAEQTNEDYDYKAIFFNATIDRLPLIINEDLDSIEDIILRWRLDRSK